MCGVIVDEIAHTKLCHSVKVFWSYDIPKSAYLDQYGWLVALTTDVLRNCVRSIKP